MRKKLLKLSAIEGIIALVLLIINFFFFHFVTDTGITTVFQEEAGKPFVAMLIGVFAVLNLFASLLSLLIALVVIDKN